MKTAAISDKGYHRRTNQDFYHMDRKNRYFLLADGMGGHKGGEVASCIAVHTAHEALDAFVPKSLEEIQARLRSIFNQANRNVFEKASSDDALEGMGTTLLACYLYEGRAVLGHVGDSRAYLFASGRLLPLTRDHSLVEEMVENGNLTPEEAFDHPKRHIITKAIGTNPDVEAEVKSVDLRAHDKPMLLLCSDGLTDAVREEEMERICKRSLSVEQISKELMALALERGGLDNITVAVIDIE